MKSLVLKARRHGEQDCGIVSRLSDENHLFRNGKIDIAELIDIAEVAKVRWEDSCAHLFERVFLAYEDGSELPNVTYIPSNVRLPLTTEFKKRGRPKAKKTA